MMATRSKSRNAPAGPSPFRVPASPLPSEKFTDPQWTANGEPRATVAFTGLKTLWFNTGTLCNLACANCYIESSPTNDALVYLSSANVRAFLDEIANTDLSTREIGFTGGEPFMNPEFLMVLEDTLTRGFDVLVLTNAMQPMRRREAKLLELGKRFGDRLTLRVSLDHHTSAIHEAERGAGNWGPVLAGLQWLAGNGLRIAVAGRQLAEEETAAARTGFAALFDKLGLELDAQNPEDLILFPEMDATADIAEITTGCWSILKKSPEDVMCATSRMVVHRKGESAPSIVACTLLPYEPDFSLGQSLAEAALPVALNHPHCARFCVLGGASCSA
ncbi:MAG: radical SAM protein [Novosphingobium sp.]|nr:radical SAM protein [Novosphingobium sp.]